MKKKKPKISAEEELGLDGTETVKQLYTVYIQHYTSGSKLTEKARGLWQKKYQEEKNKK